MPPSRFDPVGLTLIKLYPEPQTYGITSNYLYQGPVSQDVEKWDIRADFIPSAKDNFFWRFSRHDSNNPAALTLPPPAYGGDGLDWITEGINTGASWNHVFTPNLIMSIRGAYNYPLFIRDNPAQTGGELLNRKYGIKGVNDTIPGGFANFAISGYRGLGIGGFNPVDRDLQNRQIAGDVTWTPGRHTVKFGANILRQRNAFNWDFSALKNFQLHERLRLQFRFEAFHFTNTPRFGQAGNVVGTTGFGIIPSADTPRNLQFGLKLIW